MKIRRHFVSTLALCALAASVPLSGCVAGTDSTDDDTDGSGDEQVAEAESAFGEAACATDTSSPNATDAHNWALGVTGDLEMGTPFYGDSVCTNAFRVVYTNPPFNGCTVKANWSHVSGVTLPNNATNCTHSVLKITTYDNLGAVVASGTSNGLWATLFGSSFCLLPSNLSVSGSSTKLSTAQAMAAQCFTDPITHKLICLYGEDGVTTQMSCPAF